MKTRIALFTLILFVFSLTGCATAAPTQAPSQPAMSPAATMAPYDSAGKAAPEANFVAEPVPAQPRLVVKNAELTLVVEDPAGSMTAIMNFANEMGGYVVSSNSSKVVINKNGMEVPQAFVSVRVPAEKLDAALAQAKKLVKDPTQDIQAENITGKDVTAEYVDTQSRLTALQENEKALQRMQDAATKTSDVMDIFNKLTDVRLKIEQAKGQIKYYEQAAALSMINVKLLSKAGIAPLSIGGWEPVGVVRDAFQTLIDILKTLFEILVWLVIVFLPVGVILFFPGRWLWRWGRKAFASKPRPMMPYGNLPMMPMYPQQGPLNQPEPPQPPKQPGQPPQNTL